MNLRIEHDDAHSPSDWADPSGPFLMAWHTREFWVPPPGAEKSRPASWTLEVWTKAYKPTHKLYFIEAYIHSGVVIARNRQGNFCDRRWDVSENVGCVAIPKDTPKQGREALVDSIIAEWNQYLEGDVWGYIIEEDDGTQVDSCWGIYGHEYAVQEGREAMEAM